MYQESQHNMLIYLPEYKQNFNVLGGCARKTNDTNFRSVQLGSQNLQKKKEYKELNHADKAWWPKETQKQHAAF